MTSTCIICGKEILPGARESTCSEKCHTLLIERLLLQFGEFKDVTDMKTGKTYRVPTRDILEKGIKQEDLKHYPEVS